MKNRKVIVIGLILLALGIGFMFLPVKEWALAMQVWIKGLGLIGPLVFILIYVLATVFLIPGSALTLAAGAVFGLWLGFITVVLGANLGALVSYLLAKTKLRDKVREWAASSPKFSALDRAIEQNGFKMVTLARLSPIFPFTLLNYLLGLTSVRTGSYALANLLGMLPATFLYVYFGSIAGETLTGTAVSGASTLQLALKIVGLLATIGVVVFVTRIARKALAEAESEQLQPAPNYRTSEVQS